MKFGYKDYNDAIHNGIKFTLEEAKKLKTGDKAIVLSTHDSDDNYSLNNRLFEGNVTAYSDCIDIDGYCFEFSDPYFNDDEGGFLLHPKLTNKSEAKQFLLENYLPTTEQYDRELWFSTCEWAKEMVIIMDKYKNYGE